MLSGVSHEYRDSCSVRIVAPRCCNSVGLVGYKLQKLLHRIWICNKEILFIPLSFGIRAWSDLEHYSNLYVVGYDGN